MPKFLPLNIDTLRDDAAAVGAINANFQALAALVEQFLSRDGTSPNTMNDLLDMNNQRIVNLPFPLSPSEPARLSDITDASTDLAELLEQAEDILTDAVAAGETIVPAAEAAQAGAEAAEAAASGYADDAASFATEAAAQIANLVGSSTTSNSIGTGSKSFTTQTGKTFVVGNYVIATRGTTDFMWGQVTAYSGTELTINVTATSGSGTYTDWVLSASAPRGPQGPTGATGPVGAGSGDVNGPGSATDGAFALFDEVTGKLIKDSGIIPGSLAAANSINNSNWSGTDLALINGGTGASLTDPNADRMYFWDDSAGATDWLSPGTGLGISGTSIAITDAELLALAGLTSAADKAPYFTGSGTAALMTVTSAARSILDDASTTAIKTTLSLENVSNTSDANKPVSTATQTALDDKETVGKLVGVLFKTAAFTIGLSDVGKLFTCSGSFNITIPTEASVAFPIGSWMLFRSAGTHYVVTASGVVLTTPGGNNSYQYITPNGVCGILKVFSNTWAIFGQIG